MNSSFDSGELEVVDCTFRNEGNCNVKEGGSDRIVSCNVIARWPHARRAFFARSQTYTASAPGLNTTECSIYMHEDRALATNWGKGLEDLAFAVGRVHSVHLPGTTRKKQSRVH